jgi:malonyl-CoA/methylmalonyl-CoA synthetase
MTRVRELDTEPAVTIGDRTLTYAELRAAAGALATAIAPHQRIAVWSQNTLATVVALVAALESGIEAVPLNPKLGSSELEHILADSRPQLIVGGERSGHDEVAEGAGIPALTVELDGDGELPALEDDPEAVALIIYTSGTTGRPKGVLMPRRAITSNLEAIADAWAWTAGDSLTHALPLFHVHGLVLGTVGPLRIGGHLHHLGSFSAERAAAALAGGDTMLFGVPTMYHRLADAAENDAALARALAGARLLVSGSAPLPAKTFNRIKAATGQEVVERYGLTETIMNTAVRADGEKRPGEVGRPVAGVELQIIADDGSSAPPDGETIGEVVVKGPNLFLGYLNRPEATAEVVKDGWFWTGDVATRMPDGYVRIVGRKSTDIIKTGGFKVGAGEIESALLEHAAVSEAAVKGIADDDLGERITAWVVLREGCEAPTERELVDHVAAQLTPHKRPRQIYFVSELPRNAMGKVVKQRLG